MQISVEDLDAYRAARKYSPITAAKELVILRQFFGFCFERPWIEANVAKKIKTPRNVKPEEVRPYTQAEITKMIAACDAIGHDEYTRLCARAVVLLPVHGLEVFRRSHAGTGQGARRPNLAATRRRRAGQCSSRCLMNYSGR
jgi:integrase